MKIFPAAKIFKKCMKRHPKTCKRFAFQGDCRFGRTCAYNHKEITLNTEDSEMKDKSKTPGCCGPKNVCKCD